MGYRPNERAMPREWSSQVRRDFELLDPEERQVRAKADLDQARIAANEARELLAGGSSNYERVAALCETARAFAAIAAVDYVDGSTEPVDRQMGRYTK